MHRPRIIWRLQFASAVILAHAILLTAGCSASGPDPGAVVAFGPEAVTRQEKLAGSVTIYRDKFGMPHVFGATDASVVFGFMYARAEDEFDRIEQFYIRALGRTAELQGTSGLGWDLLIRGMEVERHSREEYERADPKIRALCDAFADALNCYLRTHPDTKPKLLTHYEPWYALAGQRAVWSLQDFKSHGITAKEIYQASLAQSSAAEKESMRVGLRLPDDVHPLGCNAWAIGPERSATGHAMLMLDQHLGMDTVYECHLHSDEGYHVSGWTGHGCGILPFLGFNERLGWTITHNNPDWIDIYEVEFDDPKHPLAYRYGDGTRNAVEWTDVVRVKGKWRTIEHPVRFRKTHHGPILARRNGKSLAVKVAKIDDGGVLRQLYHMGRARTLEEFKQALDENALVNQNVLCADSTGDILYVYNGLIPRRAEQFDWSKPVDGSTPATEWQGFHSLAERPQVLNPTCGFLQNCNSTPFTTASDGNPDPSQFPSYMIGSADREKDNLRAKNSRRLLSSKKKFTFDEWSRLPFDTYIFAADQYLPQLLAEERQAAAQGKAATRELRAAIDLLSRWDRRSDVDSVETTLFMLWYEFELRQKATKSTKRFTVRQKIAAAQQTLKRAMGTWRVPWGKINRLQRRDLRTNQEFSDDRPSLPIAGTVGAGSAFVFYAKPVAGQKRRYGGLVPSRGYLAVVEFGKPTRARSIVPFGQSMDPNSKHYFDQAPLYAAGQLKPTWLTLKEVKANAVRAYHPGQG